MELTAHGCCRGCLRVPKAATCPEISMETRTGLQASIFNAQLSQEQEQRMKKANCVAGARATYAKRQWSQMSGCSGAYHATAFHRRPVLHLDHRTRRKAILRFALCFSSRLPALRCLPGLLGSRRSVVMPQTWTGIHCRQRAFILARDFRAAAERTAFQSNSPNLLFA